MISKKEVQHIANLARMGITKEEEEIFQKDLSSILDYFNSLKEVDTSTVEPTFYSAGYSLEEEFWKMRRDEPKPRTAEETSRLKDAFPEQEKDYLKVKSILN